MDSEILNQKKESFGRLLEIMDRLRSECPWNKAQTIDTLRPLTIEEVYELSDAILKKSDNDIKKGVRRCPSSCCFLLKNCRRREKVQC